MLLENMPRFFRSALVLTSFVILMGCTSEEDEGSSPAPVHSAGPSKPRSKWTALDEAKYYGATHYINTWSPVTVYCLNTKSTVWIPCSVDTSHHPEQLLCKGGVGCKPNKR